MGFKGCAGGALSWPEITIKLSAWESFLLGREISVAINSSNSSGDITAEEEIE